MQHPANWLSEQPLLHAVSGHTRCGLSEALQAEQLAHVHAALTSSSQASLTHGPIGADFRVAAACHGKGAPR